jgi:phosphate starvation-inducible PhoH-like protein
VGDRNLKMLREALGISVSAREGELRLDGPPRSVEAARRALERIVAAGGDVSREDALQLIAEESSRLPDTEAPIGAVGGAWWEGPLTVYAAGRQVNPRTANQATYIEAIRTHDLVIGSGPAGTGKTYLAVAAAVHMLRQGRVRKLVLVRPAIEAGEKLGFLPGDLQAKINPYLRPLLDALHDMLDYVTIQRFIANDVVEIAPLAYMRGRTLNASVVILDEGQNTTTGQMQMFLTRMGHGSKMIVTGDPTQIDLPDPTASGLIDAARRLARVRGVAIVALDKSDVVRHDLVQRIVEAYAPKEAR